MLEPWIIEQIRRREEEQKRRNDRPQLEIPVHDDRRRDRDKDKDKDDEEEDRPERGVMIIDFG